MRKITLLCSMGGALVLAASPVIASADAMASAGVVRTAIGQPGYIVQKGELLSSTTYSHGNSSSESDDASGVLTANHSGDSDTGAQALTYGVTDQLSFNVRGSYESSHGGTDTVAGATTDTHSQGFADPTFGVTWRALEQGPNPVAVDLSGTFSPNWIRSKTATPTQDGTIAYGGAQASLSAAVTRMDGANIYFGSIAATHHGTRVIQIQSGPYDRIGADFWSGELTVGYDRALTPQIDVSLTGHWAPTYSSNFTNLGGNGLSYADDYDAESSVNLGVNDILAANKVALALNYSHVFDHDSKFSWSGQAPSSFNRHATSDNFGVTLRVRL